MEEGSVVGWEWMEIVGSKRTDPSTLSLSLPQKHHPNFQKPCRAVLGVSSLDHVLLLCMVWCSCIVFFFFFWFD